MHRLSAVGRHLRFPHSHSAAVQRIANNCTAASMHSLGSKPDDINKHPCLRDLQRSMDAHKGIENARYASLATIEPSTQLPSVRTIVIRGLYNNNALVTTTDIRSHKVKQWYEQREQRKDKRAYTELMFWLGLSKEQFRFMCWVELIDSETSDTDLQQHRKESWSKMPPSLRSDFENPPPGSQVKRQQQGDLDKYDAQETDEKTPSKNFAVVLLHPLSCDYLRLKTPEADAAYKVQHRESVLKPVRQTIRWLHTFDESKQSWNVVELNP